jgi:CheY-like chemotaxis protein
MKHNFVFEKYTVLHKFKLILSIFLLVICAIQAADYKSDPEVEASRVRTIRILCVDDTDLNHKLVNQAVKIYNKNRGDNPEIVVFSLYDGADITVDLLHQVNLVLCDIDMPREFGHTALARLKRQAELQGFTLPPFIATTSETDYHNIGEEDPVKAGERFAYARREHFIGGRGKVCKLIDLQKTLDYCSEVLGDKWLAAHVGRYITPPAVPKLLVDIEEPAEVLEEEPGRPTFSAPHRTTYGSSSMSSGSPKKYSGKKSLQIHQRCIDLRGELHGHLPASEHVTGENFFVADVVAKKVASCLLYLGLLKNYFNYKKYIL